VAAEVLVPDHALGVQDVNRREERTLYVSTGPTLGPAFHQWVHGIGSVSRNLVSVPLVVGAQADQG